MSQLIRICKIFLVVAVMQGCSSTQKEQIQLKIQQSVGDEFKLIHQTEANSGAAMSMKDKTEMTFRVASIDSSSGTVIYNYITDVTHMKSEFKMGTEVEYYDSNKSESSMTPDELYMHQSLKTILDSNLFISINAYGDVVRPFQLSNGSPTESPIDMSITQIRFPKEPIYEGYSWENERSIPITNQVSKAKCTVKKIDTEKVIIEVKAEIPGMGGLTPANSTQGEYTIDKRSGKLISGKLSMKLPTGGDAITNFFTM